MMSVAIADVASSWCSSFCRACSSRASGGIAFLHFVSCLEDGPRWSTPGKNISLWRSLGPWHGVCGVRWLRQTQSLPPSLMVGTALFAHECMRVYWNQIRFAFGCHGSGSSTTCVSNGACSCAWYHHAVLRHPIQSQSRHLVGRGGSLRFDQVGALLCSRSWCLGYPHPRLRLGVASTCHFFLLCKRSN